MWSGLYSHMPTYICPRYKASYSAMHGAVLRLALPLPALVKSSADFNDQ